MVDAENVPVVELDHLEPGQRLDTMLLSEPLVSAETLRMGEISGYFLQRLTAQDAELRDKLGRLKQKMLVAITKLYTEIQQRYETMQRKQATSDGSNSDERGVMNPAQARASL